MRKEFVILSILAALVLLPNLGDRIISGDEAYTVMIGKTVLEHGIPTASYENILVNPKPPAWSWISGYPLYTWISWIQFYISAGITAIAGVSTFWQRIPFLIFGIASVILTFAFIEGVTKKRELAWLTSLLLITSVPFLLHMRQVRWYAPTLFFTLGVLYGYWKLLEKGSAKMFIISAILLFHTNQLHFFEIMAAVGGYHLFFKLKSIQWKQMGMWLGYIFLGTFPWFYFTDQFTKAGGTSFNPLSVFLNISLNFYYIFTLITPALFILAYYFVYKKEEHATYFLAIMGICILFLSIKSNHLPATRYLINILPLFCWLNAEVLLGMYKKQKEIAIAIGLLLIFTNLIHISPMTAIKEQLKDMPIPVETYEKIHFLDASLSPRSHLFNYLYELTHEYTSVEEAIIEHMKKVGKPGEIYLTSDFIHTLAIYLPEFKISNRQKRAIKLQNALDLEVEPDVPNWIIPRKFAVRPEYTEEFLERIGLDLSKYQKYTIPLHDMRWANAPDPLNHQYWTKPGKVELYYNP